MEDLFSSAPLSISQLQEIESENLPREEERFIVEDIDKSGQALIGFMRYRSYIDSYNAAVNNDIPNAVVSSTSARFMDKNGDWYIVQLTSDVSTLPPMVNGVNISPYTAKMRNLPYMASFYGVLELLKYNTNGTVEVLRRSPNIKLFELPAMLGSCLCNLYDPGRRGLKRENIEQYASDPLGYFIVYGEMVVYNVENLRFSQILCYMGKKEEIKSVMTCNIVTRTSQVTILAQAAHKGDTKGPIPPKGYFHPFVYGLHLKMFGTDYNSTKSTQNVKNTIPAFILHLAFGMNVDQIRDMIYRNIPDKNKEPVYNRLLKTLHISINHSTDVWRYLSKASVDVNLEPTVKAELKAIKKQLSELYAKMEIGTITPEESAQGQDLTNKQNIILAEWYSRIKKRIHYYLFPQMNDLHFPNISDEDSRWKRIEMLKLELLTIMIVEPARIQVGYRPLDDRDDMANKRIQDPGRSLHTLVATGWQSQVVDLAISPVKESPLGWDPNQVFEKLTNTIHAASTQLRADFIMAMTSGNWRTSRHPLPRTNATTHLDRSQNNFLALISLIRKVIITQNVKSRVIGPRDVHPGSSGSYCPFQTPDTQRVGQRKYLSILARITPTGATGQHFELLKDDISYVYQNGYYPLIFNGMFLGWVNPIPTAEKLRQSRRQEIIPAIDPETLVLIVDNKLIVSTDPERVVRPLFRVNPQTNEIKIVEYAQQDPSIWNADPSEMLSKGLIEYLDQGEINLATYVAESIDSFHDIISQLDTARRLVAQNANSPGLDRAEANLARLERIGIPTHVEIDPMVVLGTTASTIFDLNMNQAPRAALQAKMGEKAMGVSPIIPSGVKASKTLCYPTKPIGTTHIAKAIGIDKSPVGRSVNIAILTDPYAQEDSFVFSQSFVDTHALDYTVTVTKDVVTMPKNHEINRVVGGLNVPVSEETHLYHAVDVNTGYPIIGSYVTSGDVVAIVNVTKYDHGAAQEPYSEPQIVEIWNEGYIWDWYVQEDIKNSINYLRIIIKQVRIPRVGDKYNFKPAQKGTLGAIRSQEDMPSDPTTGQTIDVIFNPHAIPSRGTLSMLIEIITGRSAVLEGKREFGASYRKPRDLDELMTKLIEYGYEGQGMRVMIDGQTGEFLKAKVFTGIAQIHALPHNPIDKVKGAGLLRLQHLNPQTRGMRSGRDSGAKLGEMARWAIIGHQANEIFRATACEMPAPSLNAFCIKCGQLAVPGPIEVDNKINMGFSCPRCLKEGEFGQALINHAVIYTDQLLSMFGLRISFDMQRSNRTLSRDVHS